MQKHSQTNLVPWKIVILAFHSQEETPELKKVEKERDTLKLELAQEREKVARLQQDLETVLKYKDYLSFELETLQEMAESYVYLPSKTP